MASNDEPDFLETFRRRCSAYGLEPAWSTPDKLASKWSEMVSDLTDGGYAYTIFELDDQLHVRKIIEDLLQDEVLKRSSSHGIFEHSILEADRQLKAFFIPGFKRPNTQYWWEQGLLKEAGPQYVENAGVFYGVAVKNCEHG